MQSEINKGQKFLLHMQINMMRLQIKVSEIKLHFMYTFDLDESENWNCIWMGKKKIIL